MCLDLTLSTPLHGTPIHSTSPSPTTCNKAVPSPTPANDCILVDEQEDECTPRSKRTRKEKLSPAELQLLSAANSMMAKATQPKLEPSEDLLWCQSIACALGRLEPRVKALCKVKIQRVWRGVTNVCYLFYQLDFSLLCVQGFHGICSVWYCGYRLKHHFLLWQYMPVLSLHNNLCCVGDHACTL